MLMHTIARSRAGVFPYRSRIFFRHTLAVIGATLLGSVVALLLMAALTHQAAQARPPASPLVERAQPTGLNFPAGCEDALLGSDVTLEVSSQPSPDQPGPS